MSIVWVVVLAVFVVFCYLIGQGTTTFAFFGASGFFIGAILLYVCPLIVAAKRDHPNTLGIAILNILLGWTLIGWVGALIWAHSALPAREPSRLDTTDYLAPKPKSTVKTCPYCAEEIRSEAIKCKHCGSDLSLTAADLHKDFV